MPNHEHPIQGLMGTAMEKIREMMDVNTVIGDPITAPNGTVILPVSKVSVGFASGGSDLPTKDPKQTFGGGSGAGITIKPIAFIVVTNETVRLLQLSDSTNPADTALGMVPELVDRLIALFKKEEKKDQENSDELSF